MFWDVKQGCKNVRDLKNIPILRTLLSVTVGMSPSANATQVDSFYKTGGTFARKVRHPNNQLYNSYGLGRGDPTLLTSEKKNWPFQNTKTPLWGSRISRVTIVCFSFKTDGQIHPGEYPCRAGPLCKALSDGNYSRNWRLQQPCTSICPKNRPFFCQACGIFHILSSYETYGYFGVFTHNCSKWLGPWHLITSSSSLFSHKIWVVQNLPNPRSSSSMLSEFHRTVSTWINSFLVCLLQMICTHNRTYIVS